MGLIFRTQVTRALPSGMLLIIVFLLLFTPEPDIQAQVWRQVSTPSPPIRYGSAMAYDSDRKMAVMFGGYYSYDSTEKNYGDTWEWNGSMWTEASKTGPTPRRDHAMAYDSARKKVVLFGGYNGSSYYGDTWEWDGSSWTSVSTTGPDPRAKHAMAYDAARGEVILFGGETPSHENDTWAWNGSNWTEVGTTGPTSRVDHAMAYDAFRSEVVLYSGFG